MNGIAGGIMREVLHGTELTAYEKERKKTISKVHYIFEQYFEISRPHHNAFGARFPRLITNAIDAMFRQMSFNILRGPKVITPA